MLANWAFGAVTTDRGTISRPGKTMRRVIVLIDARCPSMEQ